MTTLTTRTLQLSAGPIDYLDTGGPGRVLVLTHGVPMTGSVWREVLPALGDYRCILPTMPLGAHRRPMNPEADLSQRGQVVLLAEFLHALDLSEVTVIANDWGAPQFLGAFGLADQVARLVLIACEAFDNFPPPPARPMARLARVPGGVWLTMQALRTGFARHSDRAYGGMSLRGIPEDLMDEWFAPGLADRAIRRDFGKFARSAPPAAVLLEWSSRLGAFTGPVLVVWAQNDTMMPREHGPRLARAFPQGRLVEIADTRTLIPLDQPDPLAAHLLGFLRESEARLLSRVRRWRSRSSIADRPGLPRSRSCSSNTCWRTRA